MEPRSVPSHSLILLHKLHKDLGVLHPDKFKIIATYYKDTNLQTQLISRIAEVYGYLMIHSDPTLSENYNSLKIDFKNYLLERIKLLTDNPSIKPIELQIRDVIFASEKILEYRMNKLEPVRKHQAQEVHALLETLTSEKQTDALQKQLQDLETKMAGG